MLYVFYGTDTGKGRAKLAALLNECREADPHTPIERIDGEVLTDELLLELEGLRGLFSNVVVVVLNYPSLTKEGQKLMLDHALRMATSENLFVIFEGELDQKLLAKLKGVAQKVVAYGERGREVIEPTNRFAITDALLRRDRKSLWVLYERARREAVSEEELHGLLFWQVKSMLLAQSATSATEAGLKPFVFSKARSGLVKFKEGELQKLSSDLVRIYHEARRGRHDLGVALERWVLSV